jgi:hypothetical protein
MPLLAYNKEYYENFSSHPSSFFFAPYKEKKIQKTHIVQISVKFTLKKVRETFPELFRDEKEILRGGMKIFRILFMLFM